MLKFTAAIHSDIRDFIEQESELNEIVDVFGSPANIIFPKLIHDNVESFEAVMRSYRINGKIFYAHKSNQSKAVVDELSRSKFGIDVASVGELESAIANGFNGERIEATGPKNQSFIRLALQQEVTFNVDNMDEFEQIIYARSELGIENRTKVLVRLSNFAFQSGDLPRVSRFGIDISRLDDVIGKLLSHQNEVDFLGFSFHIDTTDIGEKVSSIKECIRATSRALESGLSPKAINIGGGFRANYLQSGREWNDSISELKRSFIENDGSLSWNRTSFGLSIKNGVMSGEVSSYDYHNEVSGPKYLDQLLSTRMDDFQDQSLADILGDMMIDLYIEPGRSLVYNLGFTIARVNFVKEAKGEILLGLDMKKSDISFNGEEVFMDPIIISGNANLDERQGVYMAGNLCMETDMIFNRKVFVDRMPSAGDLIVFPNTSAYAMDFSAARSIQQRIANKVAVVKSNNGYRSFKDEEYRGLI